MNISGLRNSAMTSLYQGAELVSKNKGTIIKAAAVVTAITAVAAIGVCFFSNPQKPCDTNEYCNYLKEEGTIIIDNLTTSLKQNRDLIEKQSTFNSASYKMNELLDDRSRLTRNAVNKFNDLHVEAKDNDDFKQCCPNVILTSLQNIQRVYNSIVMP